MEYKTIRNLCIAGVAGIILLIVLFSSIATIPTGFVGVKTRFGKVQETMINEGFNLKAPFIEKIVKIDCRTQKIDYTMEASSRDLQKVSNLKISVNYNVSKDSANQLYRNVGTDYKTIVLEPAIYEAIKSTIAGYTAEELITKRDEVSALALEALYNRVNDKGIYITALSIADLSFSAEFDAAIEAKQIVEQQTKQAEYELEKAKIENEKAIENAKAEAEVMRQQNAQITEQTLRLKELEIQQAFIEKWNGQLSTYSMGNSVRFINIGDEVVLYVTN